MTEDRDHTWGLAACGSCGAIDVEVDDTDVEPVQWRIVIHSASWYVCFGISGPSVVSEFLDFLQTHNNQTIYAVRKLGSFGELVVEIVKDDEFPDRFFLKVLGDHQLIEQTLVEKDVDCLITALIQAIEDLP